MYADEMTSRLKNAYSYELAGVVCTNLTRTCACPRRRLAGVWVKWWDNNIPGNCLMGCPEPTELMDGLASYTSLVSVKPKLELCMLSHDALIPTLRLTAPCTQKLVRMAWNLRVR